MKLRNNVLKKYLNHFALIFLDDILIYSKLVEELYGKLTKCEFYTSSVHYLGHIIFEKGLVTDPKKIEAIKE